METAWGSVRRTAVFCKAMATAGEHQRAKEGKNCTGEIHYHGKRLDSLLEQAEKRQVTEPSVAGGARAS